MDEEEKDIFSKAREVLKDDESALFAERFRRRKEEERKLVDRKAQESLDE